MAGMSDSPAVPTIDLVPWFHGDEGDRARVAAQVDDALQRSGFMLVTGHGITDAETARTRALAREFFALPAATKQRYAVSPVDGRGWLSSGVEANAYSEGGESPPDLKESLSYGADTPTGDPEIDRQWFAPNRWPDDVDGLAEQLQAYIRRMRALADELMTLCAVALDLPADFFADSTDHPTYTFNVNWYPGMAQVGRPADGQFRIGPHTDFGTLTLLHREEGAGGLQVHTADDEWVDAPFHPEAFTINVGDLLSRWTGDRWRSARHRVLPPQDSAPDEDLVSLVFFYECNADALVESLPPPVGHKRYTPVYAGDYLLEKYRAISIG